LDLRLAERQSGPGRLFAYCPLLPPAAAFIAGIIVENAHAIHAGFVFATLLLTIVAVAGSWTLKDHRRRLYLAAAAACLAFFCVGAVRVKCYYRPHGDDIRRLVDNGRTLATVRGRVLTKPAGDNPDLWKFGRYHWAEPGRRFYVKASQVKAGDRWVDVSGIILVQAPADVGYLRPGDYIQLQCWLDGFGNVLNPGQFDVKESMRRRNICVAATVESADGLTLLSRAPRGSLAAILGQLRERTSGALLDEILAEHDATPMLTALLLGQRSDIDIETADAFQKTGLAHYISLSGMNLAILAMTGWRFLRMSGLSRRWRAVVCILTFVLYLLIVPLQAPILRAAVICWTFFLAIFFARKSNPWNTLSIAVLVGLLIRPTDVFTAGWQLSYGAVAGIILFHRPISNWILERTADPLYVRLKGSGAARLVGLLTWVIDLFAVGVAAWFGGSGILLYHFGSIGPLASVWTVLVFPLVWGILVFGFAKILLTLVFPTVALALGLVLSLLADAFIVSVRFLADMGFSEVRIGRVSGLFIVGYYVLVVFLRFTRVQRPAYRRLIFASAVTAILVPLVVTKYVRTHRGDLEMTSLAAGHGQAIVLAFPGSQNVLFDAGSRTSKNCGWRTVVPFLRHKGIGRIHHLVISHADIDHVNGIPEIAATVNVDHIWASAAVVGKAATVSTAGYLNACLTRLDRKIEVLDNGVELSNRARVTMLWPTPELCADTTIGDNDKSMVLLVEFAGRRILLCGDIERHAQEELLVRNPDLKVNVLVMPHHGSVRNLVDGFVERLAPDIIVVNCSRSEYIGAYRPPEGILALYTPVDGAVTITIKADGAFGATGFSSNTSAGYVEY
jgi:competence protein ComEC